jgi:hypothetical protein
MACIQITNHYIYGDKYFTFKFSSSVVGRLRSNSKDHNAIEEEEEVQWYDFQSLCLVKAIHECIWIYVNCPICFISSASSTYLLILPAYAVCKDTVLAMAILYLSASFLLLTITNISAYKVSCASKLSVWQRTCQINWFQAITFKQYETTVA